MQKLNMCDLGDAICETRQWSVAPMFFDNMGMYGNWY